MKWYKTAKEINDIKDIPNKNKGGDCYQSSGRYIVDNALFGNNENIALVHGIVTGQGDIDGIEYGHAWVEDGEMVIDTSKGRDIRMPKAFYYAIGHIDPSKCFRYTPEQVQSKILETKHWGPWDLQSKY